MSTTSSQQKPSSSRSRRDKDDTTNPDLGLTQIGNYMLQKTVGEGNFAKVKLARHKLTGVEVAIKIIDKTTLDDKKLGKLYREVRIMKMLHHPNIVKLYEVIETKSTVFLIMEYASGGELYDYLVVHGKMKEKEARVKFRQILSAVSYCHKKRVIHRDLKAENLLLDANLDIKIADFGFSNMFDPDSKLDTFCGSPPYAAPELFQGRRYTGPEVDIWSLGVILYVLTTGCLPFDGKNLQEMRESVCRGKYRIPFYLSDTCEKLLRKFLIRDPLKRANLDMLIDDPWINESFDSSPIVVDTSSKIEEDESLVRIMEAKFHIDRDSIVRSLRENVYDDTAAIYYLLYHEKDMRNQIAAELAIPLPSKSHDKSSHAKESHKEDPAMGRIEEDAVAQESGDTVGAPVQRRDLKAKPKKRRFTVGGEADVAKLADEDEEAAELLKKLQNQAPAAKDDTAKPSVGATLSHRVENTTVSTAIPTPPSHPPPTPPATAPTSDSHSTVASANTNVTNMGSTDGTDEVRTQRKRHNTIVGILRSTIRRPSESAGSGISALSPISPSVDKGGDVLGNSTSATTATINSTEVHNTSANGVHTIATGNPGDATPVVPGEENKPRSLRFTFNSNTTSSRPPDEIMHEVISACDRFGITHRLTSRFLLDCQCASVPGSAPIPGNDIVKIEIEICKLPRLKNLHGLRFKRVGGSSAEYKEVCEKILGGLSL